MRIKTPMKLFLKREGCPKCQAVKPLLKDFKGEIYWTDELDGLTEASYLEIRAVPTLVIPVGKGEKRITGPKEIMERIKNG